MSTPLDPARAVVSDLSWPAPPHPERSTSPATSRALSLFVDVSHA